MATPTTPTTPGAGFDVTPAQLSGVAGSVALHQGSLDKAAKDFLHAVSQYMDCGGYGSAAEAVSASYVKVGNLFLDTWAKAVAGIGGVATGFVVTANNYARAEAASHPSGTAQPQQFPLPQVIDSPPQYPRITDLKWGDMDDYSGNFISWLLEGVPDWAMDIVRKLLHHVFRWGKAADILPLPDYQEIDKLALAWLQPGFGVTQVEGMLNQAVGSISDPNNGEWQAAMRTFTSSLWGTTAWGTSTVGYEWKHDSGGAGTSIATSASHPVMSVLWDTTQEVSQALREFAVAAAKMRHELWSIWKKAVKDALPNIKDGIDMGDLKKLGKSILSMGRDLGISITLEIDQAAMSRAVTTYENECRAVVARLDKLVDPLQEASRAVPTYQSEQARAQAFGARSLNEFKHEHKFMVPGQNEDDFYYPIDLASQEGLYDSHPITSRISIRRSSCSPPCRTRDRERGVCHVLGRAGGPAPRSRRVGTGLGGPPLPRHRARALCTAGARRHRRPVELLGVRGGGRARRGGRRSRRGARRVPGEGGAGGR
ncbi:hypothetical protein [Streptomyces sp. NPDC094032]|uniref:hypothetical protein n=1 Tax=Streptomyces sp. NPDC094032 TaxID=3155308 RepID=UPI003331F6CE